MSLSRSDFENTRPLPPGSFTLSSYFIGLIVFFSVLAFSMVFATYCRSFYTDDNVVAATPFIIESARQVKLLELPLHTWYAGGGGGTPLVGRMADGALNPFTLIPALLLSNYPNVLINVIASLHLALFALGGWFLSRQLKAPLWAGLVAAFSLGLSGCYWLWAPNWLGMMVPYAFLPWLSLGILKLVSAEGWRNIVPAQALTGIALCCLFYSGMPNPILYSGMATSVILIYAVLRDSIQLKQTLIRLLPQALLFALIIVPLIFKAIEIYGLNGRNASSHGWGGLSLPIKSYMGLFIPASNAPWNIPWKPKQPMSNLSLSVGLVPAWFIAIRFCLTPSALRRRETVALIIGLCVFVTVLSPKILPGMTVLFKMPLFHWFRWPVRAFPAFHFLLLFLFLSLTVKPIVSRWLRRTLVMVCLASSIFSIAWESDAFAGARGTNSWYRITYLFPDAESWSSQTLAELRSSHGYVLSLCRAEQPTADKPRLYFHGNLGAQYQVPTVGNYCVDGKITARNGIGMDYRGRINNWEKACEFLQLSPKAPLTGRIRWNNGIEPASVLEFVSKTYVAAVVVEKDWREPIEHFLNSSDWRILDEKEQVILFIRSTKKRTMNSLF